MNKKVESVFVRSEMFKPIARAIVPRSLRNWIRSPSKSAEWLWDFTKFSFGATKSLPVLSDWSVVCHPEAYRVFKQAQLADAEQREEFHSFVSHCSDRMFLFDIGAHFGIFSLATAHFGGRAIAIDPSPEAARMILAESTLNRCVDKIQIVQTAVGDSKGMTGMLSYGPFAHGYFMVVGGRSKHELTRIPTTTIDEMAHQFGMPTHIKIDVEGYEAAVLRGGSSDIKPVVASVVSGTASGHNNLARR